MNQELVQYLQQQIKTTDVRLKRFTHTIQGTPRPKRLLYGSLSQYLSDFITKKSANRLLIIPGFRGVGKTTLMAQLAQDYKDQGHEVIFLSIEESKDLFDAGVAKLMSAYQTIVGTDLESITKPVLIFLDEVQSDPRWAVSLKSLYEKTTNIFFCCTGSSALILQTTTNLARRAVFEKLPPLAFTEFQMIKNAIPVVPDLQNQLLQATYFSTGHQEAYQKLSKLQPQVNQYWTQINRYDVRTYLAYGTLPFAFEMPNELAVYDSIALLLDKIIKLDLPKLVNFDASTLAMVKRLLFAIAENDITSLKTLEDNFGLNRLTIANIFDALEKTELLIKVPAYGSNMTAAKKAIKYLFMSPALRMSFYYITGQESTYLTRQGKLLEDLVGSQLYREFVLKGRGTIRYDSALGGADFIVQILNNRQLIMEVGLGDKKKDQIAVSSAKIMSDYNLLVSDSSLSVRDDLKLVSLPLDFFLLM